MPDINPQETLARFVLSRSHYSPQNNRVKYNAFMPNRVGELSVFRIQGLLEEQIWEVGQRYVSGPQDKTLHGRGDVVASVMIEKNLSIIPDDDPPGHANVVDWPAEKSECKLVAMEIAQRAELKLHN